MVEKDKYHILFSKKMEATISLCMITKDEEASLGNCLNLVKNVADEVIIVDTGSKDKTKEIARKHGAKVYKFGWCNDFSKARNFSIRKAAKDWILVLDPDEKISKNDLLKIKEIISSNKKDILGYRLIQETYCNDKVISIRGICRVFKNDDRIKFTYPIHETVRESIKELNGRIGKTGIILKHYPRIDKEKQEYYLRLLEVKKEKFPYSNVDKEIENEHKLNPD